MYLSQRLFVRRDQSEQRSNHSRGTTTRLKRLLRKRDDVDSGTGNPGTRRRQMKRFRAIALIDTRFCLPSSSTWVAPDDPDLLGLDPPEAHKMPHPIKIIRLHFLECLLIDPFGLFLSGHPCFEKQ